MAELSDLSFSERLWYHRYSFRRVNPIPFAPLRRPISESRVALVTSAGLQLPDDEPFEKVKGGDFSFRIIPGDARVDALLCSHPSSAWDRDGVIRDANLALPLDRLREMEAAGEIGSVAPRHLSFQGSITAPGRLVAKTAPEGATLLQNDEVDLVLLTPV